MAVGGGVSQVSCISPSSGAGLMTLITYNVVKILGGQLRVGGPGDRTPGPGTHAHTMSISFTRRTDTGPARNERRRLYVGASRYILRIEA